MSSWCRYAFFVHEMLTKCEIIIYNKIETKAEIYSTIPHLKLKESLMCKNSGISGAKSRW